MRDVPLLTRSIGFGNAPDRSDRDLLPFPQRAAAAAGLAYQDPVSHLCLNPKYGAWFSLRCLLVFDGIQYTGVYSSASCCEIT